MNLLEASITRFLRDVEHDIQFGIITAWRGPIGKSVNFRNVNNMIDDIKSNGLSFTKIIGFGQEEGGKVSREPSLIVKNLGYKSEQVLSPAAFDKYMIDLGISFDQFGLVLKNAQGQIQLIVLKDDNGNKIHPKVDRTFSTVRVDKIAEFFSKLKGHVFVFEYFHPDWSKLSNWIEGMGKETQWKKELNEIMKGN